MKNVLMVLAIAAALSVSSMALAKEKKEGGAKKAGLHGKIEKIDGTKVTIKGKDGTETVVVTDDSTKVTVDDKPATLADLKEGEIVAVTPETGTAVTIAAHTAGKKAPKTPATAPAGGDAK